jgi:hypothetical protein
MGLTWRRRRRDGRRDGVLPAAANAQRGEARADTEPCGAERRSEPLWHKIPAGDTANQVRTFLIAPLTAVAATGSLAFAAGPGL